MNPFKQSPLKRIALAGLFFIFCVTSVPIFAQETGTPKKTKTSSAANKKKAAKKTATPSKKRSVNKKQSSKKQVQKKENSKVKSKVQKKAKSTSSKPVKPGKPEYSFQASNDSSGEPFLKTNEEQDKEKERIKNLIESTSKKPKKTPPTPKDSTLSDQAPAAQPKPTAKAKPNLTKIQEQPPLAIEPEDISSSDTPLSDIEFEGMVEISGIKQNKTQSVEIWARFPIAYDENGKLLLKKTNQMVKVKGVFVKRAGKTTLKVKKFESIEDQ